MCWSYSALRIWREKYTQAREPLIKLLIDPDTQVHDREQAAAALKKIGDSQSVSILLKVFENENEDIQRRVIIPLKALFCKIRLIYFGERLPRKEQRYALENPDVSSLVVPMLHLRKIVIETSNYNVYQVERFITYAVNYIGQQHLKHHVDVHLYGDPEQLHSNLRNSLTNLCKRLYVHKMAI